MNREQESEFEFIRATTKQHYAEARKLFLEYADSLLFDLCFQDFDKELEGLEEMYKPEEGGVILLRTRRLDDFVGCGAIRRIDAQTAELKRMYIKGEFRGKGLGEQMLNHAIKLAKELNYKTIRLDTMPSMTQAISLYRKYGFKEIAAYRFNPDAHAVYLELGL